VFAIANSHDLAVGVIEQESGRATLLLKSHDHPVVVGISAPANYVEDSVVLVGAISAVVRAVRYCTVSCSATGLPVIDPVIASVPNKPLTDLVDIGEEASVLVLLFVSGNIGGAVADVLQLEYEVTRKLLIDHCIPVHCVGILLVPISSPEAVGQVALVAHHAPLVEGAKVAS